MDLIWPEKCTSAFCWPNRKIIGLSPRRPGFDSWGCPGYNRKLRTVWGGGRPPLPPGKEAAGGLHTPPLPFPCAYGHELGTFSGYIVQVTFCYKNEHCQTCMCAVNIFRSFLCTKFGPQWRIFNLKSFQMFFPQRFVPKTFFAIVWRRSPPPPIPL